MKKYIEGIRFGMILQLIIGPMCLLVFHTSNNYGFFFTIPLIFVIALVDAIYITLACVGVSKLLEHKKLKNSIQILSAIVLIVFGINTILNIFDISIIPGFEIHPSTKNMLLQGFLLALSNPITIMFWGSVLTTKIMEDKMGKVSLLSFCCGLVSATLIFQTFVAIIGSFVAKFIPLMITNCLNVGIGLYIIYLGMRQLMGKPKKIKNQKRV